MYIYKITNSINDKVYIGQSSYKWEDTLSYYGSGVLIEKAIKAHGKENFKKDLLEVCFDKNSLDNAERYWISHFKEKLKAKLYNITDGGTGGITYSRGTEVYDQIKHKLGKWKNGNPGSTQEAIIKRINTFKTTKWASGKDHGNYGNSYCKGKLPVNAKPVIIYGIEYASTGIAAKVLGFKNSEVVRHKCISKKNKNYYYK
jgi:group I intron endonuclease